MQRLTGKVAIVTGATSGIGGGCAEKFASEGAKVALIGRNASSGKALEDKIRAAGGEAKFIACDVSNEDDVRSMIASVVETFGGIDILMNNAGVMLPSMEIERMPVEDWKKTFDIKDRKSVV